MKRVAGNVALALALSFLTSATLLASPSLGAPASSGVQRYQYLSPEPGARYVSPWNNVIIRLGPEIRASLGADAIVVTGSHSGLHDGALALSDDAKTVVFTPHRPFELGETVVVRVDRGITTLRGDALPALSYTFQVTKVDPKQQRHPELDELLSGAPNPRGPMARPRTFASTTASPTATPACALPTRYIHTTLLMSDHPDPGRIFLSPITQTFPGSERGRLLILDNYNMPVFFRDLPVRAFDFKRLPNGRLVYAIEPGHAFMLMDSTYAVVDSFRAGNGYIADSHEFVMLPEGHVLLMAYDWEPVDMSTIVPGGDPNALVAGLIIQELDTFKNVVFQWRSWDHFPITDMIECVTQLTEPVIDYVHGNAIEPDTDGNLLISSRHLNEITKIDRSTGEVIWRLGLNAKNNDFTFVGDTRGFSHQHDIRRLPNGNITLFDNGNCLAPEYSRGLEYTLDEDAKIATLVWEYRNTPDTYDFAMGNLQRFADGGTLIGWGAASVDPNVTELHADGTKAWEIGFSEPTTWSYRAFRFPWETTRFVTSTDSLDFGAVPRPYYSDRTVTVRNPTSTNLNLTCFVTTDYSFFVTNPAPVMVPAFGSTTLNVRFQPLADGPLDARLYFRSSNATELVARVVEVRGVGQPAVPAVTPAGLALLGGGLLGVVLRALRRRRWSAADAI